jgi:hypothetical protein
MQGTVRGKSISWLTVSILWFVGAIWVFILSLFARNSVRIDGLVAGTVLTIAGFAGLGLYAVERKRKKRVKQ